MKNAFLNASDGTQIYLSEWQITNPKAYVLIVHGLGEHIGRYDFVARFMNQQQFSVIGYDHRGHGQSSGKRGVTLSYEFLLDDLELVVKFTKTQAGILPVFIYAHSMGGNIALNYLLKRKPNIHGLICTGSAIKLAFEPNALMVALGKITRKIYPAFAQNNQLIVGHISRTPAVVEAYQNDPLVHNQVGAELGLSVLETGKWLMRYKGEPCCPLLLMHGQADLITDAQGSVILGNNLSGDVTVKIWPQLYHEIHNEAEREEVLDYASDWIHHRM